MTVQELSSESPATQNKEELYRWLVIPVIVTSGLLVTIIMRATGIWADVSARSNGFTDVPNSQLILPGIIQNFLAAGH